MIEQALARSIPAAISFLANLVGLGDLAGKIRGVIERVRAPVTSAVDWILNRATGVARRLGGMVGGDEGAEQAGNSAEAGQTAQRAVKDPVRQRRGRQDPSVKHYPATTSMKAMQTNGAGRQSNGLKEVVVSQPQRSHANDRVQRLPAGAAGVGLNASVPYGKVSVPYGKVQRQKAKGGGGTNGSGSGAIKDAKEVPYDVSGKTLEDLREPLKHFGDHGAETSAPITIDGKVVPQKREDGTMFIKVKWITVDVEVRLPRWTDYKDACPAAQQEWDRFMGQTRVHEQQAHVDKAKEFVEGLGEEDTVIEGSSPEELKSKLEAKAQELKTRLQAIHDGCDHGASVDAFLHPEKGVCE
jgi:predicted secreted Zn-dependent protease